MIHCKLDHKGEFESIAYLLNDSLYSGRIRLKKLNTITFVPKNQLLVGKRNKIATNSLYNRLNPDNVFSNFYQFTGT